MREKCRDRTRCLWDPCAGISGSFSATVSNSSGKFTSGPRSSRSGKTRGQHPDVSEAVARFCVSQRLATAGARFWIQNDVSIKCCFQGLICEIHGRRGIVCDSALLGGLVLGVVERPKAPRTPRFS